MKTEKRVFKSKIISSEVADVEVEVYEGNKGIWNIICPECEIAIASASTHIQSDLRSLTRMQLPGYGNSRFKADAADMTLDDHMLAMDSVCPSENAVLYGYSHCGYFTTQYALQRAGKISALILVEPALYSTKEDLLERAALIDAGKEVESMASMITTVDSATDRTDAQVEWVAKSLVANVNSDSTVAQEFRIRAEHAVSDEDLAKLDIPVLLIAGTESNISYMVKRAFQAIPQASVSWIEGAGHLDLEKGIYAEQVARAIEVFVESLNCNSAVTVPSAEKVAS